MGREDSVGPVEPVGGRGEWGAAHEGDAGGLADGTVDPEEGLVGLGRCAAPPEAETRAGTAGDWMRGDPDRYEVVGARGSGKISGPGFAVAAVCGAAARGK